MSGTDAVPIQSLAAAPSFASARAADVILSDVRPTSITSSALRSINILIDELLWLILAHARSLDTGRLKNGVLKTIPTQLGKDAILEAEIEMRAYRDKTQVQPKTPRSVRPPEEILAAFPLQEAFDFIRLKCQVLSSFSDIEEDAREEGRLLENYRASSPIHAAQDSSDTAPLYLTTVIEHICQHLLGNVARVVQRDSSRTGADIHIVYTSICEDSSIYPVFKNMKVHGYIVSHLRPSNSAGVLRKKSISGATELSLTPSNSSTNLHSYSGPSGAKSPISPLTGAKAPPSSFANRPSMSTSEGGSVSHTNGRTSVYMHGGVSSPSPRRNAPGETTGVGGAMLDRESTDSSTSGGLVNGRRGSGSAGHPHQRSASLLSGERRSSESAIGGPFSGHAFGHGHSNSKMSMFDELLESGGTMRVSLTPDRMKTFEPSKLSASASTPAVGNSLREGSPGASTRITPPPASTSRDANSSIRKVPRDRARSATSSVFEAASSNLAPPSSVHGSSIAGDSTKKEARRARFAGAGEAGTSVPPVPPLRGADFASAPGAASPGGTLIDQSSGSSAGATRSLRGGSSSTTSVAVSTVSRHMKQVPSNLPSTGPGPSVPVSFPGRSSSSSTAVSSLSSFKKTRSRIRTRRVDELDLDEIMNESLEDEDADEEDADADEVAAGAKPRSKVGIPASPAANPVNGSAVDRMRSRDANGTSSGGAGKIQPPATPSRTPKLSQNARDLVSFLDEGPPEQLMPSTKDLRDPSSSSSTHGKSGGRFKNMMNRLTRGGSSSDSGKIVRTRSFERLSQSTGSVSSSQMRPGLAPNTIHRHRSQHNLSASANPPSSWVVPTPPPPPIPPQPLPIDLTASPSRSSSAPPTAASSSVSLASASRKHPPVTMAAESATLPSPVSLQFSSASDEPGSPLIQRIPSNNSIQRSHPPPPPIKVGSSPDQAASGSPASSTVLHSQSQAQSISAKDLYVNGQLSPTSPTSGSSGRTSDGGLVPPPPRSPLRATPALAEIAEASAAVAAVEDGKSDIVTTAPAATPSDPSFSSSVNIVVDADAHGADTKNLPAPVQGGAPSSPVPSTVPSSPFSPGTGEDWSERAAELRRLLDSAKHIEEARLLVDMFLIQSGIPLPESSSTPNSRDAHLVPSPIDAAETRAESPGSFHASTAVPIDVPDAGGAVEEEEGAGVPSAPTHILGGVDTSSWPADPPPPNEQQEASVIECLLGEKSYELRKQASTTGLSTTISTVPSSQPVMVTVN